jgi:nicotinate-nucleotide--dimethylbenzimidazole phosphoribosyltransferase
MKELEVPDVVSVAAEQMKSVWATLDSKTKPPRSLGRLEEVAARWATLVGAPPQATVVVMAADHGIAAEGVSAYPQQVTGQMLSNFAAGGAAINALCAAANADLVVVDVGTLGETPAGVRNRKVRAGSANFVNQDALTTRDVKQAFFVGVEVARELGAKGVNLVGLGEMGIANTTVASALSAVFTGEALDVLVGRGTGIDDAALQHKHATIARALAFHVPDPKKPWRVLEQVGGLELVGLCGLAIGCASQRIPVVMDGFITGAAMLAARAIRPNVVDYLFASHLSVEPGHRVVLRALGLAPLLDLDLRLGEGSGAALSLPMFGAAHRVYCDMATFESAGVSSRR